MAAMHEDELAIDTELARRLVDRSFPEYVDLPLTPLGSSGSSNALFRLGDELLVRMPRQPGGSATIEKEARWVPLIAAGLTATVPEPVALGQPGFGYPETWAVTRWIGGIHPLVPWEPAAASTSSGLARDLAQFVTQLRAIHVPDSAPTDPALNWYRGGSLTALGDDFHHFVEGSRQIPDLELDLDVAVAVWMEAIAAERAGDSSSGWYHGDLFAENLLVSDGRLVAALDFGGLAIGDGTVDLSVAWEVLDAAGRDAFWHALEVDDNARVRSMGWALLIALMTFPYYWHTMPERCAARRTMAAAVLAEAGSSHDR